MRLIGCGLLALALGLLVTREAGAAPHPDWIHTSSGSYPPSKSVWSGITIPSAPPVRRMTYSAIAYSRSLGRQGSARNHTSLRAAQRAALSVCGGHDVRLVVWGASGTYMALAVGDDGAAGATGRTAAQARANALRKCRRLTTNCQVYALFRAP